MVKLTAPSRSTDVDSTDESCSLGQQPPEPNSPEPVEMEGKKTTRGYSGGKMRQLHCAEEQKPNSSEYDSVITRTSCQREDRKPEVPK